MTYQSFKLPRRLLKNQFLEEASYLNVMTNLVNRYFPLHWHDFYELEFVMTGEGTQRLNGVEYPFSKGALFLLTPADFHEVTPREGSTLKVFNVKFTEAMLSEELREFLFRQDGELYSTFADSEFQAIITEFSLIQEEHNENLPMKQLVIKGALERVLVKLLRSVMGNSFNDKPKMLSSQQQSIHKALMYIHHHFREPITLETVARQSQLSAGYFSECFHEAVGTSFKSYLQGVRLQFAATLLTSSDMPVSEICYASGFNSLSHFMRAFKDKYQVSPNAYRKQ